MLSIEEAAQRIRSGELVAFPTETVYGLGANALDAGAVSKIFAMKGRPATSPLIVHVSSIEMARGIVTEWPGEAEELAQRYWPGPLTMVLPKAASIPDIVTAGLRTVGVRMPNHPVALKLIELAGVPIAAPSANRFASLSPTTAQHVRNAFRDQVPVIDGGSCQVGIESTVISIHDGKLTLLRPGMIAFDQIEQAAADQAAAHAAPGMHPRHYSPRTRLIIVAAPEDLPDRHGAYLWRTKPGLTARCVRLPRSAAAYAHDLYRVLHEVDGEGWPWIAVEAVPETPQWAAIRDRLNRASSL